MILVPSVGPYVRWSQVTNRAGVILKIGILHPEVIDPHTIISSLPFCVLKHNTAYILPTNKLDNWLKKIPTKNGKLKSIDQAKNKKMAELTFFLLL